MSKKRKAPKRLREHPATAALSACPMLREIHDIEGLSAFDEAVREVLLCTTVVIAHALGPSRLDEMITLAVATTNSEQLAAPTLN